MQLYTYLSVLLDPVPVSFRLWDLFGFSNLPVLALSKNPVAGTLAHKCI